MKQTRKKPYWEMTARELAEATKEFDKPIPLSRTRPLTPKERASFERMRRSPSRSIYFTEDENGVLVRIEPDLLKKCAQYAAEQKISLSEVINRSLRGMMAMVR